MSEIKQARLIDGDTVCRKAVNDLVKNRLNKMLGGVGSAEDIEDPFDRGKATAYENVLYDISARLPSKASEGEAARLREALEKIVDVLSDDTSITAQRINNIIILALSSHTEDARIQREPENADRVRQMYAAWKSYDGKPIFSGETIANTIADVALAVGISIPGIDPSDPINFIPGINTEEDKGHDTPNT
jgi:hypothetical protein